MAQIKIHRSGPLTTVQDRGRFGLQALGVPTAGAADSFRYRVGNGLLGNPEGVAALEYWLMGPEIEVIDAPVRVLLAGSVGTWLRHDGLNYIVPAWQTVTLQPGERLTVGKVEDGAVGYVCFAGGVDVPVAMGSRSTYVRAKLGGYEGRALKLGDVMSIVDVAPVPAECALLSPPSDGQGPLRVVLGPQDDYFDEAACARFFSEPYKISPKSDRMGKRLVGPALSFADGRTADIVSDGMVHGSIQVPGSGEPIIMLCDRATVGGYAKIGTVISADLPRFARCKPGVEVHFSQVTVAEAEAARYVYEQMIIDVLSSAVPVQSF